MSILSSAVKVPSKADLIASVEALSFTARWRVFIPLRTALDNSAEIQHLVTDLATSPDAYERAIAACIVGDSKLPSAQLPILRSLLLDPVDSIARRVTLAAVRSMALQEVREVFPLLTPSRLHRCCRTLMNLKRVSEVDVLLQAGESFSSLQRQRLLAFASAEQWRSLPSEALWLGTFCGPESNANWRCMRQLTEMHPAFVVEALSKEAGVFAAKGFKLPTALDNQISTALIALSSSSKKETIDLGMKLLTAVASKAAPSSTVIDLYNRHRPAEVLKILQENHLDSRRSIHYTRRIWRRIRKDCPPAMVTTLCTNDLLRGTGTYSIESIIPTWVAKQLYVAQQAAFVKPDGSIDARVLCRVGAEVRQKEAERCIGLKVLEASPAQRVPYLGLLPYPKAVQLGAHLLSDADHSLRASCAGALVDACRYYPEHLADVLDYGLKRKNEQDPWKVTFYGALSRLPCGRWEKDAHLGKLQELIDSAATAKDLSNSTINCIVGLISNIISSGNVDFTVKNLPIWTSKLDYYHSTRLQKHLTPTNVLTLWNAMLPQMQKCINEKRGNTIGDLFDQFANYVECAGIRRTTKEKRRQCLGSAPRDIFMHCLKAEDPQMAEIGMQYMLKSHKRETIEQIIPQLLAAEPDWIFVFDVRIAVSTHIQGPLLLKYLTTPQESFVGRFEAKHRNRQTGPFGFEGRARSRWTSATQRSYADSILAHVQKEGTPVHTCRYWFSVLRDLPALQLKKDAETDFLYKCATDMAESAAQLRDYSLQTFAYLSDAVSLEVLSEAVADVRGRTALPALKRRLRFVGPNAALSVLAKGTVNKQVTVQKELIRSIGALGTAEAYSTLQKEWAARGPELHKDLRLTLLQAYFRFLEKEEVWAEMLATAKARDPAPTPDVALALGQCPDSALAFPWQRERFCDLMKALLSHPNDTVACCTTHRIASSWATVEDASLRGPILALLNSETPSLNNAAFSALMRIAIPAEELIAFVASKTTLPKDSSLPRFIDSLVSLTLHAPHATESRRLMNLCEGLRTALSSSQPPRQISLCCDLLFVDAPDAWPGVLVSWETAKILHCGALARFVAKVGSFSTDRWASTEGLVDGAESAMRKHASPSVRRVGLALLQRMVVKGWTDAHRGALEAYQADPDAWVRDDASLVVPPPQ